MPISESLTAALKESQRADLQPILSSLKERHGEESLKVTLALLLAGEGAPQPFNRGLIAASALPDADEILSKIWFGLYPGSLVYFCGESGAGKSSLLYNICIHAARNEPLWDIRFGINRPLKVLYVDPENSGNFDAGRGGTCLQKLIRINQGKPDLLWFHDGDGVNLSRPGDINNLEELITAEQYDIVVLDPIINLFNTKDENDNGEGGRQFASLKSLAKRTNCCIVAVHHTGKDTLSNTGRGATARIGAADIAFVLRVKSSANDDTDDDYGAEEELKDRDDHVRLQMVKNRNEPGKASIFLKMEGKDRFGRVTHADWKNAAGGTSACSDARKDAEEEIYLYLLDGKTQTTADIIAAMRKEGIGENKVRTALLSMKADGTVAVSKTGKGGLSFYQLASAANKEEKKFEFQEPTPKIVGDFFKPPSREDRISEMEDDFE